MSLTPKQQRAVKAWFREDFSMKNGAQSIGLSRHGFEYLLWNAKKRLGLASRYHLAVYAATGVLLAACAHYPIPGVDQHEPRPMLRNAEQSMIPIPATNAPRLAPVVPHLVTNDFHFVAPAWATTNTPYEVQITLDGTNWSAMPVASDNWVYAFATNAMAQFRARYFTNAP